MSNQKKAHGTETQVIIVYKYMIKHGPINRYNADELGVCHLAARIKGLEEKGFAIGRFDENNVADFHGVLHDGIRRYFIDWGRSTPEAVEYFARLSND